MVEVIFLRYWVCVRAMIEAGCSLELWLHTNVWTLVYTSPKLPTPALVCSFPFIAAMKTQCILDGGLMNAHVSQSEQISRAMCHSKHISLLFDESLVVTLLVLRYTLQSCHCL